MHYFEKLKLYRGYNGKIEKEDFKILLKEQKKKEICKPKERYV